MFALYDAALAGSAAPALLLLIACTRCCVLELPHTAVSALSVPCWCFDCKLRRCLARLRPPALLTAGTKLGIRCVVPPAWVAGYGYVWHGSA